MPGDAAAEALAMVAAVRDDDPARRLRLASSFYDARPGSTWWLACCTPR